MSNDEIRELIQLVVESGIAELEVQRGEDRVRIRRTLESAPAAGTGAATAVPETVIQAPAVASLADATASTAGGSEVIVKSPIVGTYYDAPKPGDPPFVKVGDVVEPGHVLCI